MLPKVLRWLLAGELIATAVAFIPGPVVLLLAIGATQGTLLQLSVAAGLVVFLSCVGATIYRGFDYLFGAAQFYGTSRSPARALSIAGPITFAALLLYVWVNRPANGWDSRRFAQEVAFFTLLALPVIHLELVGLLGKRSNNRVERSRAASSVSQGGDR
jgi:hypothetical protein